MPGTLDHIIAASLLGVFPLWIAIKGRAAIRDLAANPSKKLRHYVTTISIQWAFFAVILALWIVEGRSWTELGLRFSLGGGFLIALALAVAFSWILWSQWRRIQTDRDFAASIRDQVKHIESFVPQSRKEIRASQLMAVTAGICEEVAYRGYILWYLSTFMHVALAIAVMAFAFGACHLYQGGKAATQIAGIGIAAALLYLLSGSLWIPMLLHIVLDWNQLSMARLANHGAEAPAAPATT